MTLADPGGGYVSICCASRGACQVTVLMDWRSTNLQAGAADS